MADDEDVPSTPEEEAGVEGAAHVEDVEMPRQVDRLRIPGYTVPAILLGVPLLAWLVATIYPPFYDQVIWPYYWGPIKADAVGRSLIHNGVTAEAGYNVVNTASWAVLLGVCIVGLAQMLQYFRLRMDSTLIIGATFWVIPGSIFHVMQDTGLMARPLEYIYITPPIYLLFGAFGVLSLLVGLYVEHVARATSLHYGLQKLWLLMVIPLMLYVAAWAQDWGQILHYVNPIWVALCALASYAVMHWRFSRTGRIDAREVVVIMPIGVVLLGLAFVAAYVESPWEGVARLYIPAATVAVGAALAVPAVTYLIARWRFEATGSEIAQAFMRPINLLLIGSQTLDGASTGVGLDIHPLGYGEKHVLSGLVIDSFQGFAEAIGWSFGAQHPTLLAFMPLKILVALLVVYTIDVYSKEDVERYPTLIGLVKFAIIMVGIGPGIRNFLRMTLSV